MVKTPAKLQPNPEVENPKVEEVPTPPTNLPYDDGEPLESPRHRKNINVFIDSLTQHLSQTRSDFYCGGNMFVYYSQTQVKNRDLRGPDFFAVLDVEGEEERDRKYWAIWEENGRYPDVIVELLSQSTASMDKTEKKTLYERTFKSRDYFIFDPYNPNSLEGWSLDGRQQYRPLEANDLGWLWCETLGLWLGRNQEMLRFFDGEGNLVLLPEEVEHQRAETERQRAETERQRAQTAESEVERLRALLREQGIEPDGG